MNPIDKLAAVVVFMPYYGFYDPMFLVSISDVDWKARITWKCIVCGRRNSRLIQGTGDIQPQLMACKFGHETYCAPSSAVCHDNGEHYVVLSSSRVEKFQ